MKILFACGGTGGHVFPGVALAKSFEKKVEGAKIVFVGTEKGIEKNVIGKIGWRLEMIEAPTFADKKGLKKLFAAAKLFRAIRKSFTLLKKERPSLVIGVGGYVAAPLLIAAFFIGIPSLTLEPNAVPGLSNRLLKFFADKVVTAYPEAQTYFGKKGLMLGVPVREELLDQRSEARDQRLEAAGKKVVFLFGGSLGAKTINEAMLSALPFLSDLKEKIHFVHQTGAKADPKIFENGYAANGFSAEVYPFIEKMGLFYGKADLVIARSGANTVAELLAFKKPSILIPYPFAQGGHQEANARSLEKLGAAKILPDEKTTGEILATEIRDFITKPERLKKMEAALAKMESTNAADKIVEACLKMVKHV